MICVNVKNLKIFVAGAGVDAAAVRHRAGVGDVRGGCRDQTGGPNVKCCEMLACWLKCNEFNV